MIFEDFENWFSINRNFNKWTLLRTSLATFWILNLIKFEILKVWFYGNKMNDGGFLPILDWFLRILRISFSINPNFMKWNLLRKSSATFWILNLINYEILKVWFSENKMNDGDFLPILDWFLRILRISFSINRNFNKWTLLKRLSATFWT